MPEVLGQAASFERASSELRDRIFPAVPLIVRPEGIIPLLVHAGGGPDHSVFVGDLAPDVTDYILQENFRQFFASVRSAKVCANLPYNVLHRIHPALSGH